MADRACEAVFCIRNLLEHLLELVSNKRAGKNGSTNLFENIRREIAVVANLVPPYHSRKLGERLLEHHIAIHRREACKFAVIAWRYFYHRLHSSAISRPNVSDI